MRFFTLWNLQAIYLYLFPTLLFMVVFGVGLAFAHLRREGDQARQETIIYRYPDGIEDRDAPFPLVMTLVIVGTVIWAFFYILMTGILGVVI